MDLISNVDLWNLLRNKYPNFENHTSKGTAEIFSQTGFEALKNTDRTALNEFFELSLQYFLQLVNISQAFDPFDRNDVGETFTNEYGGYIQRLSVSSIKPVTPAYNNLQNGQTVDPFIINKAELNERFFKQNFDYQALITIPSDDLYRDIFISAYGMSEAFAGWLKGLENGYTIQKYTNKLETINAMINSTKWALQDSQKIQVSLSPTPTETELNNLWLTLKNTINAMVNAPQTGAFNAIGFETTQERSRLRLLVKQGYLANLQNKVLVSAFNRDEIALNVPIMEVANFGGLVPYSNAEYTTRVYPVYDTLGALIGYNTQENQTTVTVSENDVYWFDPNDSIIAVLADKGFIFTSIQNAYTVTPIYNPRGLYTNYWANAPRNTIAGDPLYNMVVFENTGVNLQEVGTVGFN